ncbi:MAG: hypothetical protein LBE78_05870, partial [Burkholderiaceae bacterium]|nr:hypothetical protein [Burkholderiaceae bacterium]
CMRALGKAQSAAIPSGIASICTAALGAKARFYVRIFVQLGTITPFHQNIDMKSRLCPPCCVANARNTTRYCCALRLAWRINPSISFVNLLVERSTRLKLL